MSKCNKSSLTETTTETALIIDANYETPKCNKSSLTETTTKTALITDANFETPKEKNTIRLKDVSSYRRREFSIRISRFVKICMLKIDDFSTFSNNFLTF